MTDERIVEVMARWLRSRDGRDFGSLDAFKPAAELALAALRDAGFDVYCMGDAVPVVRTSVMALTYAVTVDPDEADAFVVPVGGDS